MAYIQKELHKGARWLEKRFALSQGEVKRLLARPERDVEDILNRVEGFRDAHGLPATSSPLVRGYLLELVD